MLYFDNLSRDTADAYLADGLTEDVITRLGHVQRLIVKSRSAVQRVRKAATRGPAVLGQELGVAHLVTGSVRRMGSGVRVTVELVRVTDGVHVWGEQYDRRDADVLAIEDEIARAVATAIAGRLAPPERQALARRPSRSIRAYDHFLRGNYYLAQRTARAVVLAVDQYGTAVRLDPEFTEAWARFAFAVGLSLARNWEWPGLSQDSVLARGLAAEARALALDSGSAEGWIARGILSNPAGRGSAETKAAYERALALDSTNAEAWNVYGNLLLGMGSDSLARVALERAVALDPYRAISLATLSWLEFLERRDTRALRWADSSLAVDPAFAHGYEHRAEIRAYLGHLGTARADAEHAARLGGGPASRAVLAIVETLAGDTAAAREQLATVDPVRDVDSHLWTVTALVVVGERDRALAALARLPVGPDRLRTSLRNRGFDPLRNDPRFQRLVEESQPR
ncbi:MAG TPA: hypothetical protein VFU41_03165 [Gemmatimonadales bacterium]|nr:hypothetical protein [Gemmatimonadales bacterium]